MSDVNALDTAGILRWCGSRTVPVGADLNAAIAAHRQTTGDLVGFTLRAVILACTPDIETERQQLDYLTALAPSAWPENAGHTADEVRQATLDAMRRTIAMHMAG